MVSESLGKLTQFVPAKEFFMGVDSDGCVFDSMEIKHKECFCPTFIRHFGLQPISQFAKETWEFVNLYSLSRGCHRFVALVKALDLLAERKEVKESGVIIPRLQVFRDWMVKQSKLGNPALEAAILATGHPELTMVWEFR